MDSSAQNEGNAARLNSERLTPISGEACFKFWYHMNGNEMGVLRVRLNIGIPGTHDVDEDANEFVVWELSGNQGNEWQSAQVYTS